MSPTKEMTVNEVRASTQRKLTAVQELMRSLHLSVEARDQITSDGFIKKIVYFTDNEEYKIKEEGSNKDNGEVRKSDTGTTKDTAN